MMSGLLILGISLSLISISNSMSSLENTRLEQLDSIRLAKQEHIQDYLNSIASLQLSMANSNEIKNAFVELNKSFYLLSQEISLDEQETYKKLLKHYDSAYLNKVNYNVPNSAQRRATKEYIPESLDAQIAQYIFIVNNTHEIGSKNGLVSDENFNSTYMDAHKKYHPTFNKVLTEYGLYDIFLVNNNGDLVYTDYKEKDYATNLISGPYVNTGLGRAFKKATTLKNSEIAFDDFQPYEPSYNLAASFLSTPLFIDGKREGVIIFQMPIDNINKIMSFNGRYKEAGLGESGECYLVGSDYKMKNDSRFVKEIDNKIVKSLNTTIGVFEVKTDSTKNAIAGNSGSWVIKDYRGVKVLSAYSSFDYFGSKWAIIAEIDEEEALASAYALRTDIIVISSVIILLLMLITQYFINILIANPIAKLKIGLLGFFSYLNKESHTVEEIHLATEDEIGTMAKVINQNILKTKSLIEEDNRLIENVKKVVDTVKQGNLQNKITVSTKNESLEELKNIINEMIETMAKNVCGDINKIQNALKKFQALDFRARINNPTGQTSQGLNALAEIINNMLIENMKNGEILMKSSKTLLSNVHNLSTSSNQTAAALEQTAAALEEITSNIANNSTNISQMTTYANEVTKSASAGNELATKTSAAMDEINTEVASISEAISVIDQIAFQTNILSLNAAVEAATAGEAGKGFAVVAQEVRNLASRSAEAAKQIKEMVESATNKANNGKDISSKMIDGYKVLSENINNTLKTIKDVEIASKEQLIGIQQINDSISQIDSQTQANAAIANETNIISVETEKIAQTIVANVNEKEFIGKI